MELSKHTQRLRRSKKSALALVHSPPLCPFAQDLQDPGVKDTPVDPQREMKFLIKILPTSKISFLLNRHIKKIFLPCINSIATMHRPKELNQCLSEVLTTWMCGTVFLLKNVNFCPGY